jgi:iron(III) transport system permease protein
MLIGAYVILFIPQAIGSSRAGLARVPRSVEEAARSLGKSPARVFGTITLPLAGPSVLAGALLVFISAIKELPATLLLAPTGTTTLATSVWRHMEEASYARAAAPSLLLIGLSSLAVGLIVARERLTQ